MAVVLCQLVRPDNDRAAIAAAAVGGECCARANVGGTRVGNIRIGALVVAADEDFAAGRIAGRRDRGVSGQGDPITENLDRTAVAASAGRVQRAAGVNVATTTGQADDAAGVLDSLGADDTAVVDDVGEYIACRAAGEHDLPAVRTNFAAVADGRFAAIGIRQDVSRHFEKQQAVAVEVERDFVAGTHRHVAELGKDDAFVLDRAADQRDGTAGSGLQETAVNDQPAGAVRNGVEVVLARHEVINGKIQGACDQRCDADFRRGTEEQAVGVKEEDSAVGIDCAEYLAGVLVENAVQGR